MVIGIDTDILFPIQEQQLLADNIPNAQLAVIKSNYGHDGFLVETDQLNNYFKNYFYN
jgi:homoserine O-acetyltransferase